MAGRKMHTTCPDGYSNFCVTSTAKGLASNLGTNAPVHCLVVTCHRWMCAYVIESHMREQHTNSEEVVFILSAAERATMITQCDLKTQKGDATNAHNTMHNMPTTVERAS